MNYVNTSWLSTKASVASPKWSEKIKSFRRNERVNCGNEVITKCLRCRGTEFLWKKGSGALLVSEILKFVERENLLCLPWLNNTFFERRISDRRRKLIRATENRDTYTFPVLNEASLVVVVNLVTSVTYVTYASLVTCVLNVTHASYVINVSHVYYVYYVTYSTVRQAYGQGMKTPRVTNERDTYCDLTLARASLVNYDTYVTNVTYVSERREFGQEMKTPRVTNERDTHFNLTTARASPTIYVNYVTYVTQVTYVSEKRDFGQEMKTPRVTNERDTNFNLTTARASPATYITQVTNFNENRNFGQGTKTHQVTYVRDTYPHLALDRTPPIDNIATAARGPVTRLRVNQNWDTFKKLPVPQKLAPNRELTPKTICSCAAPNYDSNQSHIIYNVTNYSAHVSKVSKITQNAYTNSQRKTEHWWNWACNERSEKITKNENHLANMQGAA